ncbi:sodium/calcium exchanger regulatory protein 1-like [Paramacrobiotus metropolitanus]|uniref:sodium/calcium exchanger regulatory protein 1-like n=1 Tax=Paramacrobiotus metropolitanus TaxID=2943436 RepID=UPI00244591B0|nr:sodium/calcium exchanger regulatory protein 1-like [Paramacrobiotus metropolitanus]
MAATDITGKFQLTSSQNFDDYLKAANVSFVYRKLATTVESATVEIIKTGGDEYTMKTVTAVKSHELKFKLNQEFTEQTMDGRALQTTMKLEGNKLIQTQKDAKTNTDSIIEREFMKDEMVTTLKCKGAVSVRKYKRIS